MKTFFFTDSMNDAYKIIFLNGSLYVSSDNRMSSIDFDSVIVASSEGITYQKSIHKILDLKTLRYHLDSEELIQFIMKLINNKAFW